MREAALQMTFFAALLYDEKRCSLFHSIYTFLHDKLMLWNARDILTDF